MIFHNKRYEMRLNFFFLLWLTFWTSWFMLLLYVFTLFKKFSSVLCIFLLPLIVKFIKIRFRNNNIRIFFKSIDNYVKKSYCATCVVCVLFHEKKIFWNLLWIEIICLLFFILGLRRSHLIKKQNSKNGFRNHIQSPLLSW
jgi:hypothetical protein